MYSRYWHGNSYHMITKYKKKYHYWSRNINHTCWIKPLAPWKYVFTLIWKQVSNYRQSRQAYSQDRIHPQRNTLQPSWLLNPKHCHITWNRCLPRYKSGTVLGFWKYLRMWEWRTWILCLFNVNIFLQISLLIWL